MEIDLATGRLLAATALEGWVFGLLSLPICVWVACTELGHRKIRNGAVLALVAVFVVAGIFVMPVSDYLWRYLNAAVVLTLGFGLATIRAVGAGDAKFAAAMAPFVARGDLDEVLIVFAVLLIVTLALHRMIPRASTLRKLVSGRIIRSDPKDFPMGIPLAATQLVYLGLAALI